MLINVIGGWLALGGLIAVAKDLHWSPRLLIYAGLILVGIGLLRRVAVARTVAMGAFLSASAALILVPLFAYFQLGGVEGILRTAYVSVIFGLLQLGTFARFAANAKVLLAVTAFALAVLSLAMYGIYRYLKRKDVADEFGEDRWLGMRLVFGSLDLKVYLVALLCVSPLAKMALQAQMARRAERADAEARRSTGLVRRLQFSADGASLATMSGPLMRGGSSQEPELFLIGLADGAMTRNHGGRYSMNSGDLSDRLPLEPPWRRLSPDNRLFLSVLGPTELIDLKTGQVEVLDSLSGAAPLPIGFTNDSRALVYYSDHRQGKIEKIDVRDRQLVYSTDATRPEWWTVDTHRPINNRLGPATQRGMLSPNRRHFAYVYRGVLHLFDTEAGTLTLVDGPFDEYGSIVFSRESDAIVVGTRPDSQTTPVLHRIGGATTALPARKGTALFLSTAAGTLIYQDSSGVSEFVLDDLTTPTRHLQLTNPYSAVVTPDGRYLLARGARDTLQIMELPLHDASAFRNIVTRIDFTIGPTEVGAHGGFVTVVQSPMIEILRIESLAQPSPTSMLFDLRNAGR